MIKAALTKKAVQNASYLTIENLVRLVLGFFLSILVARHLGPRDYGLFNYVVSFVFLFIPFYTAGADEAIINDLVREKENRDEVLSSGCLLKLYSGLLAFVICVVSTFFLEVITSQIRNCIILLSFFMLFRSFDVIDNWYQSIISIKKLSYARILTLIIVGTLKLLFVMFERDWHSFIYISCLEIFLIEILYAFIYKYEYKQLFWCSFRKLRLLNLFNKSYPVLIIMFLNYALARVDQLMIGSMIGPEELGKYAVAVKLVDIWQFFPYAIINSLYPLIIQSYEDKSEYKLRVKKLYMFMMWMALVFIFIVQFISTTIVSLLYGEAYLMSGALLSIYSWTTLFTFFTYARTKIFVVEDAVKDGVWLAFAAVTLNIVFNYYFLRLWGVEGAIYASLLAYFFSILVLSVKSEVVRRNLSWYLASFVFPLQVLLDRRKWR